MAVVDGSREFLVSPQRLGETRLLPRLRGWFFSPVAVQPTCDPRTCPLWLHGKDGTVTGEEHISSRPRWINSTVLGIGAASLFSDVGHEMATTAMPVLLATLGVSSAALGLIEGFADGVSSFAKLFSGLYSDRLKKRKPLAVIGYFVTASGMASFALATQWWHVLLGRVGGWFGRGAAHASSERVADRSHDSRNVRPRVRT